VSAVETPLFFPGPHSQLFGILHDAAAAPARVPLVFCHPFAEEKLWAHRVFVTFARELARLGHPVLRFDYMGNGDSDGSFSASSVDTAVADIDAAVAWTKQRTGAARVGLLGLRLGATFASRVADARSDIGPLVMWAPIADAGRYVQEQLRINLTTQLAVFKQIRADRDALVASLRRGETVSLDGYEMGLPMYEQLSALRIADQPHAFAGRCLIVQVERSDTAPLSKELDLLRARYADATLAMAQEDPFWKEIDRFYHRADNLFAATLPWLGAQ
jgi:exosortase A-associated hydrolase 2